MPAESVTAYKTADHWKEFGRILPIENADIVAPNAATEAAEAYDLLGRPATGNGVRIINGKKTLVR